MSSVTHSAAIADRASTERDSKRVEIWHMHWLLLRVSAQLDQHWLPSFKAQSDDAADEALSIAKKLTGFEREFANLGELRQHLLEQIVATGATLVEQLSSQSSGARSSESRRRVAEDSLFIARTLSRCVDMRTGRLTVHHDAQLALWSSLSSTLDALEPPRRGPELVRHACTHVLERLEDWIKADLAQTRRAASPSPQLTFPVRGEMNEPV
jgi:hypothetical protein